MIKKTANILPSVFFLTLGIVYLFTDNNNLSAHSYIFATYIIFGIIGTFFYTGYNRAMLFLSSAIFMIGIYKFLIYNFELLNKLSYPFPVVIIIFGVGNFILFLDNTREKAFLIISLISLATGILAFIYRGFWFVIFGNNLCQIVLAYWEIFLIFVGVNLLLPYKED